MALSFHCRIGSSMRAFGGTPAFWSPDSRSLAFFADGKLKKIDLAGGTPQTICSLSGASGRSGTWGSSGTILFQIASGPVLRVPATGGTPTPVTSSEVVTPNDLRQWPYFLPDGRHYLYRPRATTPEESGVYLAALDEKETRRLLAADSPAIYGADANGEGCLLFVRDGALLTQRFDVKALQLQGEPFTVTNQVGGWRYSLSQNGLLVYGGAGATEDQQLTWFDRAGQPLGTVGPVGLFSTPQLSPDGKRIAARVENKTDVSDIYVFDHTRGSSLRLTFDPKFDVYPAWSADGTHIFWGADRGGKNQIYQKAASGTGQEELLFEADAPLYPMNCTSDGKFLLFVRVSPKTQRDIWVLPLQDKGKPFPLLESPFIESTAYFSPNGRWVAYMSNESGRFEVYIRPFPDAGGKWQVSANGGTFPQWRADGKELFYISNDQKLMAVAVQGGNTFAMDTAKELFDLASKSVSRNHFAVTADGQRFLLIRQTQSSAPPPVTVVANWQTEVKR